MAKLNKDKRIYYTVVAAAIIGVMILFFRKPHHEFQKFGGVVWTTQYSISYQGSPAMRDSITKIFNDINNSASMFNPNSTISKLNANTPDVTLDRIVTDLYNCSRQIHRESDGYFDPTVAPLVNAWGFGTTEGGIPNSNVIDSIMQFVGFNKINIEPNGHFSKVDSRTIVDFSSIAKGYACDEIGRLFRRNGISNYMIEIGGEICVGGMNQYGKNWHISIDMPIEQSDTVIHSSALILSLTDKGIATSGNYRNFRKVEGKKVSHIISPKTGYSEQSDVLSATIIANTAAEADAYATACIAMGFDKCSKMIDANSNIEAMLIYSDSAGNTQKWFSKGLDKLIVKE